MHAFVNEFLVPTVIGVAITATIMIALWAVAY